MLLKLLCTLCTLVSSSSLDHHTITSPMPTNDSVLITLGIGDSVTHDLCNDFTNTNCADTLFEASETLDFMTIDSQNMVLKPSKYDGSCYDKIASICFSKTYQFTISALNPNDHKLIMDKSFAITVQSNSKQEIETVMVVFVCAGSVMGCALSSCLKSLLLRFRAEAAEMRG